MQDSHYRSPHVSDHLQICLASFREIHKSSRSSNYCSVKLELGGKHTLLLLTDVLSRNKVNALLTLVLSQG
jgi:hypothetical protein